MNASAGVRTPAILAEYSQRRSMLSNVKYGGRARAALVMRVARAIAKAYDRGIGAWPPTPAAAETFADQGDSA